MSNSAVGVGYFPKRTQPQPDWLRVEHVREVCSVSECVSAGPNDWVAQWKHNALGFFDTEAAALDVVRDPVGLEMYAYRVYPLQFDSGLSRSWAVPIHVALDLREYVFLGFDLVSRSISDYFECSALSCDSAAKEFVVNSHCLIDDYDAAWAACLAVSRGEYEPGPYYLFEVYRRRGDIFGLRTT